MAKANGQLKAFAPTLALLTIAVTINYVDRGNLSLAAPLLKVEWGLSAAQLGILFSAFFWSYTSLQFLMGWLVDRFNVNWVMALGFLAWSLATAATGLVTGFAALLAMRLLLGVGESVIFPANSKILAQNLPEQARGFANGLVNAAMRWGSAVGTLGGGLLMARFGWRATFIAIGTVSLLWLPAWGRWKPAPALTREETAAGTPTFAAILRKRSFWGAAGGHFSANYLVYFLISWLPYYLVRERHLSMATMANAAGAIWVVDSLSSLGTGWLTDRCIRAGGSPTTVRKWAMAVGFSLAAASMGACALAGPHTYLPCFLAVAVGCGAANAGTFAFAQTLAGPRAAGRWVGLENGIANLSGIVGPAVTGFLIDRTGHFGVALALTAAVTLCGALAWCLGVRKLEPVQWQTVRESRA
jgi:MFS family permease